MSTTLRAILLLALLSQALLVGAASEPKTSTGVKGPLAPAEALY